MVRKVKPAWNWENDISHMNHQERSENLNFRKIYSDLGIAWDEKFPSGEDPEITILSVLFKYCDLAFRNPDPTLSERRAVLEELVSRAHSMSEAIDHAGSISKHWLAGGLTKALKAEHPSPSEDANDEDLEQDELLPEIQEFSDYLDSFPAFSKQLEKALNAIPIYENKVKKGRKPKTALHEVILELAYTFEEFTGHPAYKGFSVDRDGIGSNSFMYFLEDTLLAFDPELAESRVALATLVRRLLAPK